MLCAFFPDIAASQQNWQVVFTQTKDTNPFRAAYFFNESVGFIAGNLIDGVYKTTNGGQTWVNALIPKYANGTQPLMAPLLKS